MKEFFSHQGAPVSSNRPRVRWYVVVPVSLVILWTIAAIFPMTIARPGKLAQRTNCQSNLHQLDLALEAYCYPPVTSYPARLSELSANVVEPRLLFCSGLGPSSVSRWEEAGRPAVTDIENSTDYIYVSGLNPESAGGVPLIICPPENHDNEGGNVLFMRHELRWVPSPEVDALIDWTYAYAQSNGLAILVSKGLTHRSKCRYRSVQSPSAITHTSPAGP